MDLNLTWLIVIGIAAGFLAGKFIKRKALGLFSNLLVGIAGTLFGKCFLAKSVCLLEGVFSAPLLWLF